MFMFDKAIMLVKVIRGDPIILHEDVGLERVGYIKKLTCANCANRQDYQIII